MTNQPITIPEKFKNSDQSSGEELIPAEVAARQEREQKLGGTLPIHKTAKPATSGGYTVSEQGLINNHAVTPRMYHEEKSLTEKRRDYTMVGIVALSILALIAGIATFLNMAA